MACTPTGGPIGLTMGDLSLAIDLGFPTAVSLDCVISAGQGDFHTVNIANTPGNTTTTTTIAGPTSTTTPTTAAPAANLTYTGVEEQPFVIGLIGLLLLNFGYLTVSTVHPARKVRKS